MDLTPYVETSATSSRSPPRPAATTPARWPSGSPPPLDRAVRLVLLDALSAAADEITRDLAPGSVDLRLRGARARVRRHPAAGRRPADATPAAGTAPTPTRAATARINLRLPDQLKARIEEAAGRERPLGQRLARPRGLAAAVAQRRPRPARAAARRIRPVLHADGCASHAHLRHPRPIIATVELVVGDVRITASERTDTVVEVRPSDPASARTSRPPSRPASSSPTAACWSRRRRLAAVEPVQRRRLDRRHDRAADRLELSASAGVADVRATGRARRLPAQDRRGRHPARARPARSTLESGAGDIDVERVAGDADVTTGSGDVRIGASTARAVIKNSNGDSGIGEVTGDLRVKAANGDIAVGRADARRRRQDRQRRRPDRRGRARHGRARDRRRRRSRSASREGTAAWLDVTPSFGHVRNSARRRRRAGDVRRDRRGARPHLARRHRDPRTASMTGTASASTHRPAQVLRRPPRPRRHRPRRPRGHRVRPARPERRRQDHHRSHILSTLIPADAGDVRVAGHDVGARPGRGARRDRRHRPVLGRRRPAHRRENLR